MIPAPDEQAARPAEGDAGMPETSEGMELAGEIAAIVEDKLGEDLIVLDVSELVGYTDYLLICTARNERLAKAIHDEVYHRLKHERDRLPAAVEGETEARWVLMDYLDCVLHIFVPELRDRYRLEVLWGEAPRVELPAE